MIIAKIQHNGLLTFIIVVALIADIFKSKEEERIIESYEQRIKNIKDEMKKDIMKKL